MAPGGSTAPPPSAEAAAAPPGGGQPATGRSPFVLAAWVAVVLLGLALLSLPLRGADRVGDVPLVEDAYYALTAVDNVAAGNGPTIDGEHLTNGFQPGFTFLLTPAFLFETTTALRLVLLAAAVVTVVAALLLGVVVRDATSPSSPLVQPVVAALYLSAAFVTRSSMSGLETGFLLLMYVLWWRTYQRRGMHRTVDAVVLGVVAGVTVLARVDAAFAVGLFALVLWLTADDRTAAFRRSVAFGVTTIVVSSPWWIYNVAAFGSPVPTSGTAQQDVAFDPSRWDDLLGALAQPLFPWVSFGDGAAALRPLALVPVGVALVLWFVWLRHPAPGDAEPAAAPAPDPAVTARTDRFAWILVATAVALGLWYVTSSWASHFYGRYVTLLVLPGLYLWSRFFLALLRRAPALAAVGAVAVVAVGLASTASYWGGSLGGGNTNLTDQVVLVERTVPDGEVVGAGQSGTLGFYRDDVLNLDGKVNSEAYEQRDDIAGYLDEQQVEWLCDWPGYVESYVGDPEAAGWEAVDREGEFVCYHRDLSGGAAG